MLDCNPPFYLRFSERDEYERWHGLQRPHIGRPKTAFSYRLRTRATLREVLAIKGWTLQELADHLEVECQFDEGSALVSRWVSGERVIGPRALAILFELAPSAESIYRHPLWRLLDPKPMATSEIGALMEPWLVRRGAHWVFAFGEPFWERTVLRKALRERRVRALSIFNPTWREDRRAPAPAAAFARPDANVLYLRGDLDGFTASLALLREAMALGAETLAAWRAVFLVRAIPFAARAAMLREDAFVFTLLVRTIVGQRRTLAPYVEVNVPGVMKAVGAQELAPEVPGAFSVRCPHVEKMPVTAAEAERLPLALLCTARSLWRREFTLELYTAMMKFPELREKPFIHLTRAWRATLASYANMG
jgi:hypothetical protein